MNLNNEFLSTVKYIKIKPNNSIVNIVFNFIEYVKTVERAIGLTDEQIIAKYTYGGCSMLATGIKYLVDSLFNEYGADNITATLYDMDVEPPTWAPSGVAHHVYTRLTKMISTKRNDNSTRPLQILGGSMKFEFYGYFDILGHHDYKELSYYKKQFWIDNIHLESIVRTIPKQMLEYDVPLCVIDFFIKNILFDENYTNQK